MTTNTGRKKKTIRKKVARPASDVVATPATAYSHDDTGNAERLVADYGRDFRYVPEWGWMVWDGRRWIRDLKGSRVLLATKKVARDIHDDAINAADSADSKLLGKRAKHAASAGGRGAMLRLAEAEEQVRATARLFNDPLKTRRLFNVRNGTIDLKTGKLREHRREDYLTTIADIDFDPEAKCTAWRRFLNRVFLNDQDIIESIRRWAGYCLTGDTQEAKILIFHGEGSNGKSVLVETLCDVMGDYAATAAPTLLTSQSKSEIRADRMALFGRRLIVASETGEADALDETGVKAMTGTARISGRRPFETAVWEFDATHKIVLSTNKPPTVRGTDKGIWRRLVMIPFGVTFWDPDDDEHGPPRLEADKSLPAKLRTEYPGILAWAVRGCLAWQSSGLRIPESAKEATRAYRESEDTVSSFIAECCREGEDERTLTSAIYRHYCEFADQARLSKNKILGRNTFLAEIKKRYGNPRKVGDHRYFHGVRSRGRY